MTGIHTLPADMVGELVGGRYEVVREIGRGGMAVVYLASVKGPGGFSKQVVVKQVLIKERDGVDFNKMFIREARLASQLSHPNIVATHDFGSDGGHYYLVMEYIDGLTVGQMMRRAAKAGYALPIPVVTKIASWTAQALHHAHSFKGPDGKSMGLIHRDVSPSNILVSKDGTVKLADFGVAKAIFDDRATSPGVLVGKYGYMAPEQCLSRSSDCRSDVFSLGVVLFEATTMRRLFRGKTAAATIRAVLQGTVPLPSTLVDDYPKPLEAVVMRCLKSEPAQRYPNAREAHLALEQVLQSLSISVTTVDVAALLVQLEELQGEGSAPSSGLTFTAGNLMSAGVAASVPQKLNHKPVIILALVASALIWLVTFALLP
jgi:serine/threonine protein kinase